MPSGIARSSDRRPAEGLALDSAAVEAGPASGARAESPGGAAGEEIVQAGEVRSSRIESLRALAALGVLGGHVFGFARGFRVDETMDTFFHRAIFGGGFGVFVFFALTGYLIYWPFARRDFAGGDNPDVGRYALNRALRILPLYWVSMAVVLLLQEGGGDPGQWWRFLLFAENYFQDTIATTNSVVWSVVVELDFYLLLPFLAYAIARVARGSHLRASAFLGVLAGASLLVWYLKVYRGGDPALWRYNLPATFFYFCGGMGVALLRTAWRDHRPAWLRGALGSSDIWILATLPLWALVIWRYQYLPLIALPSAILVAACVLPLRGGFLTRALEWRWLAAIGVASYSLYIWHVPLLRATVKTSWIPSDSLAGLALIGVPLAIAVAFASYSLVEAPFLRLRRRWSSASARTQPAEPALPSTRQVGATP